LVVRRKHGAPISHYLQNEQKIVHHCAAGPGGIGTVAARILVDFGVPAPKERGVKHTVKKSISITLFEFNDFVSIRSGLVRNPG